MLETDTTQNLLKLAATVAVAFKLVGLLGYNSPDRWSTRAIQCSYLPSPHLSLAAITFLTIGWIIKLKSFKVDCHIVRAGSILANVYIGTTLVM